MESERRMCFECLQRRIEADFSGRLTFVYGVSDSPLPFGSSAVVQMSNPSGGTQQFLLNYVPYRRDDCFSRYVNEHCVVEDGDGSLGENMNSCHINPDQPEVSVRISSDENTPLDTTTTECQYLSNGDREMFSIGLGCKTCTISSRFSCVRTITSLAPIAQIGTVSYESFEQIASSLSSGSIEDHVLHSLIRFIEGRSTGRDSTNFLHLLGLPSFIAYGFPGCIRHPNIGPILGMLNSCSQISIVSLKAPYTLENILHYSPGAIKSDWHVKFVIYQLLSALAYMHSLGIAHGNIHPSKVMLSDTSWCWLEIGEKQLLTSNFNLDETSLNPSDSFCFKDCSSHALFADLSLSEPLDWRSSFHSWWKGELTNFEYLLILNRLAGRRWGDHTFYTVMPWVIDFSVQPDENSNIGWRDLRKSKWRLAKGDEQLDFTYSTSEIPHHVSDECLSELAVCSYKARRLPLSILRMAVRSVYVPNEYPSNMQRLYQWTPDECIPEFYSDPRIFYSLHHGMPDLAVPPWASTPEEFIELHRNALESTRVSRQIHHWIDIMFGYKMSGEAAIAAKNVMLPASTSSKPRSIGRRQLFTQPHPPRQCSPSATHDKSTVSANKNDVGGKNILFIEANYLENFEAAASFCEKSSLCPQYCASLSNYLQDDSSEKEILMSGCENISSAEIDSASGYESTSTIDSNYLLENIEVCDDESVGHQEILLWRQKLSPKISSKREADDIFAAGCILAELQLRKSLLGQNSSASYLQSGLSPNSMQNLPLHLQVLIEACTLKDWNRRPSAKCLLESPYFPKSVKSAYLFLAAFHLLAKDESRLEYAATLAKCGALKMMGHFGCEVCAPYCLSLTQASVTNTEAEWAYIIVAELPKCLKLEAVMKLVVPAIQKILQSTGYSHLKISILQGSFMQEIWNRIGKQAYIETIHPLIISNLYIAPHKSSAAAASVLLIGSSEELGIPITVHQTILPLILAFGKGLCNDGIDVLIRIGGLYGQNFIVKQIFPLLRNVIQSCLSTSDTNKPELMQSWAYLALTDCLAVLDGLVPVLSNDTILRELIDGGNCPYVKILMNKNMGHKVFQHAARSLIRVCQQIGQDLTAFRVLPNLKELFDELAFSQEWNSSSVLLDGSLRDPMLRGGEKECPESRMNLVLLLYPELASILGIEKLRQCCATWLLLEQFLLRHHNWKWEYAGSSSQVSLESINGRRLSYNRGSTSENTPAKLLLGGVGWSRPQPQGKKGVKISLSSKNMPDNNQNQLERHATSSNLEMLEPWYWFPSADASWRGLDLAGRASGPKDEVPWKIRASVIHSVRVHHGAVRSFAVCNDESTVFTAGIEPGFRGNIQKWELSRFDGALSYNGHEEVVNDIHVLESGRVASCDGSVHIWNGQTGKVIFVFSESSLASRPPLIDRDENMLNFNPLPNGTFSAAFHGNSYTTMDYLGFVDRLVVGTGNGSLRFIDVYQGQNLHLWRNESSDSGFPPLISSICSYSSSKVQSEETVVFPSWIAAACSTGYCSLFDMRSGKIIASWQAHDGYVTKLAAAGEHLLVSSGLDKTLRIWDLRRNWTSERTVFRGYGDGVSGFSLWGQNVVSICRNKIALSSLCGSADEDGQYRVTPQHLYTADGESKNLSVLSAISVLPCSRIFLVGTEDGHLKICC